MVCGEAVVERREDCADRTGIDAAIRVPTDTAINRTSIEASAAADAEQAFAQGAAENPCATVVENDQMKFLRPVEFTVSLRTGDNLRVDRQLLSRGRPREHLEEIRQICKSRYDFLDAHDGDVALGQRRRQPAI